jgi:hypothetical protein
MDVKKPMFQKTPRYPNTLVNGHRHEAAFQPQELLVISAEAAKGVVILRGWNAGRNRAVLAQVLKQHRQCIWIAAKTVQLLPLPNLTSLRPKGKAQQNRCFLDFVGLQA